MRICVSTEIPAHSPGTPSKSQRLSRPLLHTHQDVPYKHAVFQWKRTNNIRKDTSHGCRSLRVLMRLSWDPPFDKLWKPSKKKKLYPLIHLWNCEITYARHCQRPYTVRLYRPHISQHELQNVNLKTVELPKGWLWNNGQRSYNQNHRI